MTILDDWIAQRRLASLLDAEVSIAHAASHLADALTSDDGRRAADGAANSAWRSTEILSGLLPRTFRAAAPRSAFTDVLLAVSKFGEGLALFLLGVALRLQERRFRWALELVDRPAQEAIVRGILVHRVAAIAGLRGEEASAHELEASPP